MNVRARRAYLIVVCAVCGWLFLPGQAVEMLPLPTAAGAESPAGTGSQALSTNDSDDELPIGVVPRSRTVIENDVPDDLEICVAPAADTPDEIERCIQIGTLRVMLRDDEGMRRCLQTLRIYDR